MRGSPALITLAVAAAHCALMSCASKPDVDPPAQAQKLEALMNDQPEAFAATLAIAQLISQHNARVANLETFESRAAIELRYTDDSGAHTDACEGDIFLAPGNRGAVRLTKVGNNLMWIGGDGTRAWVFRLDAKPTKLTVYDGLSGGVELQGAQVINTGEFNLLSPASVRVLLGMAPLGAGCAIVPIEGAPVDAPPHERFEVRWSPARGVQAALRFNRDGFPAVIVLSDEKLNEVARATLTEPVRAQAANLAQGAWPEVARRVEVVAARSGSNVRIYLDAPMAQSKRMKSKFFELDALTAQLQPDVVEHVQSPTSIE